MIGIYCIENIITGRIIIKRLMNELIIEACIDYLLEGEYIAYWYGNGKSILYNQ